MNACFWLCFCFVFLFPLKSSCHLFTFFRSKPKKQLFINTKGKMGHSTLRPQKRISLSVVWEAQWLNKQLSHTVIRLLPWGPKLLIKRLSSWVQHDFWKLPGNSGNSSENRMSWWDSLFSPKKAVMLFHLHLLREVWLSLAKPFPSREEIKKAFSFSIKIHHCAAERTCSLSSLFIEHVLEGAVQAELTA